MTSGGTISPLAALADGQYNDPFALLGPHDGADGCVVRTIQPAARSVDLVIVATGEVRPMRRLSGGVFEGALDSGGPERSALPGGPERAALPAGHV